MTKQIIRKIENCYQCPCSERYMSTKPDVFTFEYCCAKIGRTIKTTELKGIPEDCPLEDYEDSCPLINRENCPVEKD